MFTPPDLVDLFARLTTNSNTIQDDDHTISKLNTLLNSSGAQQNESQTRVLDAALSLLGFNAPQLYNSTSGFTLNSLIQLLSSSVACRVVTFKNEELLVVGCLMSIFDTFQVFEACDGVIVALEKRGLVSELQKIAYNVVRLFVSAISTVSNYDGRAVRGKCESLVKLQHYFSYDTNDVPFRLLLWYLDPSLLKNDVLKILEEAFRRPFLCLHKAFRENGDWRSIIICLAISPMMFIEIRGLLHRWFLETGLDIIQELLGELMSGILDLTSTPICWGLKDDIGLRLPFSVAYLPCNASLLRIFMGPLSRKGIENIVCGIQKQIPHHKLHSSPHNQTGIYSTRIDEKSSWALAMNFPEWFYYSCALLFSEDIFNDNDCLESNQASTDKVPKLHAAKYISWILSPINQSHQLALCEFLSDLANSWTSNGDRVNGTRKIAVGYRMKPKKAKHIDEKDIDSSFITSCVNQFQSAFPVLSGGTLHRSNLLYCRVPLSILIGNLNHVSDKECEQIMHYAITGTIIPQKQTHAGLTHKKHNLEHTVDDSDAIDCDEAVAGIHLAFQLTELSQKICNSALGVEPSTDKCSQLVNITVGKYLLKCIKVLIQNKFDSTLLMDIRSRLVCWRKEMSNLPVSCEELDMVISELSCCSTSL